MSTKWSVFVALFSALIANPSAFALDAVTVAESFLTKNMASEYVDGGNGPTGFDCSGLTWYAFGHVGIEIALTSTTQEAMSEGTKLAWPQVSDLQRGDLLFFDTRDTYAGTVNHVGIYEGGGNFLHAASETLGIIRSNLNTGWISYKDGVRWTDRLLSSRRLPSYSGTPSKWFSIGNRVEVVSDNVEVRKLRQENLLETKRQGAKGTIKFGPATRSIYGLSYWWWLVDFESGKDGWVVEEDLKKVGTSARFEWLSFLQGNPGEPGDGLVASKSPLTVKDWPLTTPIALGNPDALAGVTLGVFPPRGSPLPTSFVVQVEGKCGGLGSQLPIVGSIVRNGVAGVYVNVYPDYYRQWVDFLNLVRPQCTERTQDLRIDDLWPQGNGGILERLDAAFVGWGLNVLP